MSWRDHGSELYFRFRQSSRNRIFETVNLLIPGHGLAANSSRRGIFTYELQRDTHTVTRYSMRAASRSHDSN